MAQAVGEHPAETILRIMIETDGKAQFHMRFFNNNLEQVKTFLQEDWILPSLGDAGAHVSQEARGYRATICNGEIMLENNEHTGAQAGRVLRNGG